MENLKEIRKILVNNGASYFPIKTIKSFLENKKIDGLAINYTERGFLLFKSPNQIEDVIKNKTLLNINISKNRIYDSFQKDISYLDVSHLKSIFFKGNINILTNSS